VAGVLGVVTQQLEGAVGVDRVLLHEIWQWG
jgi:hypothetical protein